MASKFNTDESDDARRMLRISDMLEEPRKMLMPIKGYENVPLVSLEKAVEPLVSILPDVRRMAWTAKERCEEPADGLTCDESASIVLYSMEWEPYKECLYFVLNATLRAADRRKLPAWFLYLRLFLTALGRLPPVSRTVYRGIKLDLLKDYSENKKFVWWGFSSCTRSVGVLEAEQFLGKKGDRTLFAINCYSGKNIRNHSYFEREDEILLLPARQFKVASALDSGNGLHIIQIDEIEPEYPLLEPLPSITFYVAPSSQAPSTNKHISKLNKNTSSEVTFSDFDYTASYAQKSKCRYGGECWNIDDEKHAQKFQHPSYCSHVSEWQDMKEDGFTTFNNPDGDEINCDTWYEGEMLENTKSDIMRYIANRDHYIFRWKWNAKIWIEQFQKATPDKFGGDFPKDPREQRGIPIDLLRRQLQMTVMLHTLGSIHHKRYFIRDREMKLNLNPDMKTIVYNHESRLKKSDKMPTKTPYSLTKINVVGDDCVDVYEKLLRHGKKPLLLNMASAKSPGGRYRKGGGAQEENLFRRSDYFRSLDVGMDDFLPKQSKRACCTSEGQLEPLRIPHKMYPMEEYGAIYTSGLTFFRQSQDAGYEYLQKPIENLCAIAMAAYHDPKLDGRLLSSKYAVGTRKKLENIFAIAHHHGHDSIVLSAFGCGAFRNPPIHIAKLFFSVIEQYAGFFETIVFAIIDDHNAGQRLNPEGNYKPFVDVLDGKIVTPLTPMNIPDTMFGPYRVSSDGSKFYDVNILDLDPCYYGAKCIEVNRSGHTRQYSHPPLCSQVMIEGKCDLTDNFVHMTSFIHRKQCPYGGKCRDIDDKKHSLELEHPSYCSEKASCQNMDEVHLKQFRHLPLCDKGTNCIDYQKRIQKHCESYRHCQHRS